MNQRSHKDIIGDYRINLASVMYGGYVKMDRLSQLAYDTFGNSSIESAVNCNIFIDINSIIHPLFSEHGRVIYDNITDISSCLINMCAHYRGFFRQLGVSTKFFLIDSNNTCDINEKYLAGYNSQFKNKTQIASTVSMIKNNMLLLKVLCPYLPQIYYVESPQNFESSVIIAHIIEKLNDGNPNMIISHDMYPIQLTALYPYTTYLYPYKMKVKSNGVTVSEDQSWMLPINEKPTYRQDFWNKVALMRKIKPEPLYEMSPLNYALYTALTSCPERYITGLYKSITAKKFITHIVGSEDIKIQSSQFLTDPELCNNYAIAQIDARYKVLDVQFMLPYYNSSPEASQIQFVDLDDAPAVNRISSKYYVNNPLDLMRL